MLDGWLGLGVHTRTLTLTFKTQFVCVVCMYWSGLTDDIAIARSAGLALDGREIAFGRAYTAGVDASFCDKTEQNI